jgi:hypothetical protein
MPATDPFQNKRLLNLRSADPVPRQHRERSSCFCRMHMVARSSPAADARTDKRLKATESRAPRRSAAPALRSAPSSATAARCAATASSSGSPRPCRFACAAGRDRGTGSAAQGRRRRRGSVSPRCRAPRWSAAPALRSAPSSAARHEAVEPAGSSPGPCRPPAFTPRHSRARARRPRPGGGIPADR